MEEYAIFLLDFFTQCYIPCFSIKSDSVYYRHEIYDFSVHPLYILTSTTLWTIGKISTNFLNDGQKGCYYAN